MLLITQIIILQNAIIAFSQTLAYLLYNYNLTRQQYYFHTNVKDIFNLS